MRMNLRYYFFIISFLIKTICFGQIEKLEINWSIYDLFGKCDRINDTTFTGVKDVILVDNGDTIAVKIDYKNGRKFKAVGQYKSLQKYRETNFNGFAHDGWDIKYYENGNKEFETYYENGKQKSVLAVWYENGNLKSILYYTESDHRIIKKDFYESGMTKEEDIGLDSGEFGCAKFITYRENASIFIKSIFNCGNQDLFMYYDDGKIMSKGKINTALWSKIGFWEFYYKNGKKMMELNYENTIPNIINGKWKFWDEKGNLIKERNYVHGIMTAEKIIKKSNQKFYLLENKIYPFD